VIVLDNSYTAEHLAAAREHVPVKGVDLFQVICCEDLEGVVCKHKFAPYVSKPQVWFEVLNPDYSQKRGRKEMFEKFHDQATDLRGDSAFRSNSQ